MPAVRAANAEPLPGYRLVELLGRGGFGEVWKCQAPGGFCKAIKFVGGPDRSARPGSGQQAVVKELHALRLLKTLRHPFLLSVERVEVIDGELLILTELADHSLHDLLAAYQADGRPGVPRDELLGYLAEAAEVLDLMSQEHGLQHLDVKPRNLFVSGGHVKVGDLGLVGSLAEWCGEGEGGRMLDRISPVYAAPERFLGQVSPACDQYSLAVAFVELATGRPPFQGGDLRALAFQHLHEEPDLAGCDPADHVTLRTALAKEPQQRFPSCLAFVHRLLYPGVSDTRTVRTVRPSKLVTVPRSDPETPVPGDEADALRETLLEDDDPTQTGSSVRLATPHPAADPLAGWQFVESLARLPFGEYWRVCHPDGRDRLVKLIFGYDGGPEPLSRLRRLRGAGLVPLEAIPTPGRLVLASPWYARTLADRLADAKGQGQAGIPRDELLTYLGEVADLLDNVRQRDGLLHLGLNPRLLVLDDADAVALADVGLVELVWRAVGQNAAALNARYAAPELFAGLAGPTSDQYSLGLLFAELLTGSHPFGHRTGRQVQAVRSRGEPDLGGLSGLDREVLATALDPDPGRRFPSCVDLVTALRDASPDARRRVVRRPTVALPPLLRRPALNNVLRLLTEHAAGPAEVHALGTGRYLLEPGVKAMHRCFGRIVASTLPFKIEAFRERCGATVVNATDRLFVLRLLLPQNMVERFLGRQPGLEVRIALEGDSPASLASLAIEVRPIFCGAARAVALLDECATAVIETIRHTLQADPERRRYERFALARPATVYPLLAGDETGPALAGAATDVSLCGMGVVLADVPATDEVAVHLPGDGEIVGLPPRGVLLCGRVVRHRLAPGGGHAVGIDFGDPAAT